MQSMTQKMKVNFYLDHPNRSYYEILLNPHKDTPHNIIVSVFQKLYPLHLHSYSTIAPAFVHVQTGTIINSHKTFAENGIVDADTIPDVRIRLKINVLPLSQLP